MTHVDIAFIIEFALVQNNIMLSDDLAVLQDYLTPEQLDEMRKKLEVKYAERRTYFKDLAERIRVSLDEDPEQLDLPSDVDWRVLYTRHCVRMLQTETLLPGNQNPGIALTICMEK